MVKKAYQNEMKWDFFLWSQTQTIDGFDFENVNARLMHGSSEVMNAADSVTRGDCLKIILFH